MLYLFATKRVTGVPLTINNTSGQPYTGTATGSLPFLPGMVPNHAHENRAGIKAVHPETGAEYEADYVIQAQHGHDDTVRSAFVGVTGTFAPGETVLYLVPSGRPPAPNFIPDAWTRLLESWVEIDFLTNAGDGSEFGSLTKIIPMLEPSGFEVMFACSNMVELRYTTPVPEVSAEVRLYLRAYKGERGIRWTVVAENQGASRWDGDAHRYLTINSAKVVTVQRNERLYDPIDLTTFPQDGSDPEATIMGPLGVRFGAQRLPVRMESIEEARMSTGRAFVAHLLERRSRIPIGGTYARAVTHNEPTPEIATYRSHTPQSGGLYYEPSTFAPTIEGGQRFHFEGIIGGVLPQSQLNLPAKVQWSDVLGYNGAFAGGIAPTSEDGAYSTPLRQRLEDQIAAYFKKEFATPLGSTQERIDRERFQARGGTFNKSPEQNPHFSWRDFGAIRWGAGWAGADHYDTAASALWNYLRDGDERWYRGFLTGAQQAAHSRWVKGVNRTRYAGPVYEKGWSSHGCYQRPALTHQWPTTVALLGLWENDAEARALIEDFTTNVLDRYGLQGQKVPATWVFEDPNQQRDARDWAVPGGTPPTPQPDGSVWAGRYGQERQGPPDGGFYGDWGWRAPGRVLEAALGMWLAFGDERLRPFSMGVLDQIVRVETQIWGARGFDCGRTLRAHRYEDGEQPVWHSHVLRPALETIHHMGLPSGENLPIIQSLHRQTDHLVRQCVWGVTNEEGQILPMRVAGWWLHDGSPTAVMRFGFGYEAKLALEVWHADPTNPGKFGFWEGLWARDTRPLREDSRLWVYDRYQKVEALHLEAQDAIAQGNTTRLAEIEAQIWPMRRQVDMRTKGFTSAHCPVVADALCAAYRVLGRTDVLPTALSLAECYAWHLGEGGQQRWLDSIEDDPDMLGHRNTMYPSTETKFVATGLKTRHVISVIHEFLGTNYDRLLPRVFDLVVEEVVQAPPHAERAPSDEELDDILSAQADS